MKKKLLIVFYIISFVYILFNFSNIYAKDLVYEGEIGDDNELVFTKLVKSWYNEIKEPESPKYLVNNKRVYILLYVKIYILSF